jgi:hypothetical protein
MLSFISIATIFGRISLTAYTPTSGSLEIFTISVSWEGVPPEELDEEDGGLEETDDGMVTVDEFDGTTGGGVTTDGGVREDEDEEEADELSKEELLVSLEELLKRSLGISTTSYSTIPSCPEDDFRSAGLTTKTESAAK